MGLKTLVILSGGMDSTVALAFVLAKSKIDDEIISLSFHYGSKHNDMENKAAKNICEYYRVKHIIIDLPFINDIFVSHLLKSGGDIPEGHYQDEIMKKTVVPFRNGIMISIAAGYAESIGAKKLVLGNHIGDHAIYPDCRTSFTKEMRLAVFEGTYNNVELVNPLEQMDKAQICALGINLNVPLEMTYSCYKGGNKHCGKCGTCVERKESFKLVSIYDPTDYED